MRVVRVCRGVSWVRLQHGQRMRNGDSCERASLRRVSPRVCAVTDVPQRRLSLTQQVTAKVPSGITFLGSATTSEPGDVVDAESTPSTSNIAAASAVL